MKHAIAILGLLVGAFSVQAQPICVDMLMPAVQPAGSTALRLAGDSSKFWPQNYTLKVQFLDGSKRQISEVWKRVQEIDKLVNLSFQQVDRYANIRVSFREKMQHWSYVGTDCRNIRAPAPTMNIGLRTGIFGDFKEEWDRVVPHEFLHAIGFIHEHQNPEGGIKWNIPEVLRYYRSMGWDEAMTYQQVIDRYPSTNLRASRVDPKSIMMYPIPPGLTLDGFWVGWNTRLSTTDIEMLRKVYPSR